MTALALALALAAAAPPPASASLDRISYESGPCLEWCPVYRVTVDADGTGLFEGRQSTAVTGERRFRISAAQFRAFAAYLAPLRPASGVVRYAGRPMCHEMATDYPTVDVRWRGRDGEQELDFYFGCDTVANRAMADRLAAAPGLLPIGDYISPRR